MNCMEIQAGMTDYWDLHAGDPHRILMDEHMRTCPICQEQFQLWEESGEWIQSVKDISLTDPPQLQSVSHDVMKRIYALESWRIPVAERSYFIPHHMRRRLSVLLASFLALFIVAACYGLLNNHTKSKDPVILSGIVPVTTVAGDTSAMTNGVSVFDGIPVASISSPSILYIEPFPTVPNYWIAFSLLGITMLLLIINWLSRVRS